MLNYRRIGDVAVLLMTNLTGFSVYNLRYMRLLEVFVLKSDSAGNTIEYTCG